MTTLRVASYNVRGLQGRHRRCGEGHRGHRPGRPVPARRCLAGCCPRSGWQPLRHGAACTGRGRHRGSGGNDDLHVAAGAGGGSPGTTGCGSPCSSAPAGMPCVIRVASRGHPAHRGGERAPVPRRGTSASGTPGRSSRCSPGVVRWSSPGTSTRVTRDGRGGPSGPLRLVSPTAPTFRRGAHTAAGTSSSPRPSWPWRRTDRSTSTRPTSARPATTGRSGSTSTYDPQT